MASAVITDANGVKTLDPVPSGEGGNLLLGNDSILSGFVTSQQVQLTSHQFQLSSLQNTEFVTSVTNHGAVGDGVADDRAAIAAADTAAALAGKWLLFPAGTYLIDSDFTFSVPVLFVGGIITFPIGVTITHNQPYMNPSMQQCFDEQGRTANQVGGVRVALASPQDTVRSEDWGASFGTADAHIPIQQSIDAFDYPRDTNGKVGRVLFSSGTYLLDDSIFVSYDWITYPTFWGAHAWTPANAAPTAWRGDANTPMARKQHVILEGTGQTTLKYTGALASTKYLLYYVVGGQASAFDLIKNLKVWTQYQSRGVIAFFVSQMRAIDGLSLRETLHVGLDYIDSIIGRLGGVFATICRGHVVRTELSNNCIVDGISLGNCQGQLDGYWPDPTDETVKSESSGVVQTPVWERAFLRFSGNATEYRDMVLEQCLSGSAWFVVVSGVARKTCTRTFHALQAGDPIYLAEDDTATTVASVTSRSVFETTDAFVATGSQLVYRRCSAISRADPGVFECQNHSMGEGQWIKIMAGSGMTQLNDVWYRVKKIDDDNFSLWTVWDDEDATPFTVPLDTSGFFAADGKEYIVSSVVGIFLDNASTSRLIGTRFEGNNGMMRAKIVTADQTICAVVDGVFLDDGNEGPCEVVVEFRDRTNKCLVTHCQGNGIEKAVTRHHSPSNGINRQASGNAITGNRTWFTSSPLVGTLAVAIWEGEQQGNLVEGALTPGKEVANGDDDETTPSVSNFDHSQQMFVYGMVMVIADDHVESITNFLDGFEGMLLRVFFKAGNSTVVHDNTKIVTGTGGNLTPAANDELQFRNIGGVWYQV